MSEGQKITSAGQGFSKTLRESLRLRYGRVPSAAFLSREFNLRHHGSNSVTSESIRRWMLGLSMPRPDHLQTLVHWLNLDLNRLFRSQTENKQVSLEGTPPDKPVESDNKSTLAFLICKLSECSRQEASAIADVIFSYNKAT